MVSPNLVSNWASPMFQQVLGTFFSKLIGHFCGFGETRQLDLSEYASRYVKSGFSVEVDEMVCLSQFNVTITCNGTPLVLC